jgi:hypothetical protein
LQSPGSGPRQQITADPTKHPPVDLSPLLKVPRRAGRLVRFARTMLKTVATLPILTIAVLAALIIWDFYVAALWTRDGKRRNEMIKCRSPDERTDMTHTSPVIALFPWAGCSWISCFLPSPSRP